MTPLQNTAVQNLLEASRQFLADTPGHPMAAHFADVIDNAETACFGPLLVGIYHSTLAQAIEAAKNELKLSGAILDESNETIYPHLTTGQTGQGHYPILSLKGKPTKKWGHVSIYRLDSGNYEQTNYIA